MSKEKIVLAYSGGLDTTVIIPWLKENYDAEVICVCGNVGQEKESSDLEKRAIATGASKLYVLDLTEEFITDYIYPCLKANCVYEHKYLLGTSMARPLIAKGLVDIAHIENATSICHGATGKGNDQLRFELSIKALDPALKIIAPWRLDTWKMGSREEEIAYLEARNIPVPMKKSDSYSRDSNIWHISHEGLDLEDPNSEPKYDNILQMSNTVFSAPNEAENIELEFEKGVPIALNGKKLNPVALLSELNKLGGKHGIGIADICENRVVGMKSRGVYETPGGTIMYYAHRELEYLTLDKQTQSFNEIVSNKLAELVYAGQWFTPLRSAISAYFDAVNENTTGTVKLKLYKGNIIPRGSSSPYSLYSESLASFTTGELFSHKDATGFINLFGLPLKVNAMMKKSLKEK